MGHVTRRFRAFGDFLYALPCKPTDRPPHPGTTSVQCSHIFTDSPGEGRRSSPPQFCRRPTDRRPDSRPPVGADGPASPHRRRRRIGFPGSSNSCASTEAPMRLPLPGGLRLALLARGAAGDDVPFDGAAPYTGPPAGPGLGRGRRQSGKADGTGRRCFGDRSRHVPRSRPARHSPRRFAALLVATDLYVSSHGVRDASPAVARRRTPWTAPASPSPAWPRPAGARAPGPGPAPSSRPRRSCRPGR